MKIAIVHDFLNQYGGAERCVEALHEVFPDAPIYTSIYLPFKLPANFREMDIRTSYMQKLPCLEKHFKKYLPLYPSAMESLDLKEFDVIVSSSSAFAKGIRKRPDARHICYCYTPMRFVWNYKNYIEKERLGALQGLLLPVVLKRLKKWDIKTNRGVDDFISISEYIRQRIRTCYALESDVIYPPVDTGRFDISEKVEDYYLVVSRLNAYKRIDLVVEAFNALRMPLRIVGEGPHRKALEEIAGPTIDFVGKMDDKGLSECYSRCRAFIFPGEEDFGIAPVEAQAAGRPVIAYAAGGALETIVDGVTGVFFADQTKGSLVEAVRRFQSIEHTLNTATIRENSRRFNKEVFKAKIKGFVVSRIKTAI